MMLFVPTSSYRQEAGQSRAHRSKTITVFRLRRIYLYQQQYLVVPGVVVHVLTVRDHVKMLSRSRTVPRRARALQTGGAVGVRIRGRRALSGCLVGENFWSKCHVNSLTRPDVGRVFRTLIKKLISELTWKSRDESFEAFDRIISKCGLL